MTDDRIQVVYKGVRPGALAQQLREAGLSVSYEPPMELEDAGSLLAAAGVVFEVVGDTQILWSVVRAFRSRFPRAEVEAPPAPELTLEERLARLDDLMERGVITEEEHARQRTRIQEESL